MTTPNFDNCDRDEWHSVVSIQLGELIDGGALRWDSYDIPWYSDTQKRRWTRRFEDRYRYRDIGILPVGQWLDRLQSLLNELMPKYAVLYQRLEKGLDPFQVQDVYHKGRDIDSAFPQTQLNGQSQDYASSGHDSEYETVHEGNIYEMLDKFRQYKDVDVMLLNECEVLFSCLFTVNANGY